MLRALYLTLAAALIGVACVGGDASHRVEYRNTTSVPINVYPDSKTPSNPHSIAPGETYNDQWVVPALWSGRRSGPTREVEAKGEDGVRIFCHRYSYEELDRISWVIQIERRDDCST